MNTVGATLETGRTSLLPLTVCYPVNDLGFGGAERQLVELARGLDKDRFRALVLTLSPDGPLESELKGQPGVVLRSVNRRSKYDVGALLSLSRMLQEHGVKIIQPFLSPSTLIGLSASVLARTPIRIVTERCGLRRNRKLGNRLYRYAEDRLTRLADVVVPNSEAGKEYLLRRGVSLRQVQVIYNGINPERLKTDPARIARIRERLGVPHDGWVLGNVANLTHVKDQATMLRAVASLARRFPDIRVALVGNGHLRGELEELTRSLGLASSVVFFGHQRGVSDFLAAFDVAVLSSRDNEGCSNFIIEAMAMGKPVVATDVGGNREAVRPGENGLLVPVGSAEAMSLAIARLLMRPETRMAMGAQGRRIAAERFSLTRMVESYQDLYLGLAERKLGLRPSARKVAA